MSDDRAKVPDAVDVLLVDATALGERFLRSLLAFAEHLQEATEDRAGTAGDYLYVVAPDLPELHLFGAELDAAVRGLLDQRLQELANTIDSIRALPEVDDPRGGRR